MSPIKVTLTISELQDLPISSINSLREVIERYEYIISLTQNSRLYKVFIVISLNEGNVCFLIVIKYPDGSFQYKKCQSSIKKETCPLSFSQKLEEARANNLIVNGLPCAVLIIPEEVRDYIIDETRRKKRRRKLFQMFSYLSKLINMSQHNMGGLH